ncbi:hypothetical protein G6F31_020726 [Rhizopus arrhizus]|nr:hypothetical protein G6F31_020726 [Rhizopus arrhizus]
MNLSDPNFQLELAANIAVAGSILLAGRNNVPTWWLGIVGCALSSSSPSACWAGGSGCVATMVRRCRSPRCARVRGPGWRRWRWWPPSVMAGC